MAISFLGIALALPLSYLLLPFLIRKCGQTAGDYLRRKTQGRLQLLLERAEDEERSYHIEEDTARSSEEDDWEKIEGNTRSTVTAEKRANEDWRGIIGFFHPFCNAGGGGERVLWAAIRATQKRWPGALCIVYTGDQDVSKSAMLARVKKSFNIQLHPPKIQFVYLTTRHYVLSSTWPHFTLLGQSLGSLVLAYDALSHVVPDVFVDTMGYAFALALSKWLFPDVPIGAYVHYPTISTDMLGSLDKGGQGVNAGAGKGVRGTAKRWYWQLFAWLYGWVGGEVDVVMTNSSWTQNHIRQLWGPSRARREHVSAASVVYPPVAVEDIERRIDVSAASESRRGRYILYIAQFRPEKNHQLVLQAFSSLLNSNTLDGATRPKLVLVGSVRETDSTFIYKLRLLVRELKIEDDVEFVLNAPWSQVLDWLGKSWVGVNGMWNEHFGIGVVEYQAAGLICVVNDSGGPKLDIVVNVDGRPTGFHARTAENYASAFKRALELNPEETLAMRLRARRSARRFTDEAFAARWIEEMEKLVRLQRQTHQ